MRLTRRISLIMLAVVMICSLQHFAVASPQDYEVKTPEKLQEDNLYGSSEIVIDADTGDILFAKNARQRMYPASTTKVMTVLLAVETGWSFDTPVVVPQEAADIPADSSLVPVYPGEETTFGDLLYGLMLHSGNDAANAIAVLVGGSVPSFVQKMNERAAELGCENTHFANPHGYHDENHYTTAEDLAKITREAMKHDEIRTIVSTVYYTMHVSERGEIKLVNSNDLLKEGTTYYYEPCIGVKTGTHSKAGNCLVAAASKDGVTLVSVALNCDTAEQRLIDSIRLLRYAFTRYTSYSIDQMFDFVSDELVTTRLSNARRDDELGGLLRLRLAQASDTEYERMIQTGSQTAMDAAKKDFANRCSIQLHDNLTAPITQGEIVGTLIYTTQSGEKVTASLIAARDIEAQPVYMTLFDLFPVLKVFGNSLVTLLVLLVLVLVLLILCLVYARRRRIEKRRRRAYEARRREYERRRRAMSNRYHVGYRDDSNRRRRR